MISEPQPYQMLTKYTSYSSHPQASEKAVFSAWDAFPLPELPNKNPNNP